MIPRVLALLLIAAASCAAPVASPPPRPEAASLGAVAPGVRPKAPPRREIPGPASGGALCGDPRIAGARLTPIKGRGGCGVANPVRLSGVSGARVSPPVSVDCATAVKLADWVEDSVRPALARRGARLAGLQSMAGYACRTRNSRVGARLSEHAFGRAIDIGALVLGDGRRITVLEGWRSGDGALLREIWRGACGPFKTVLGPESDRHHQNHFHLDVARRRARYCR